MNCEPLKSVGELFESPDSQHHAGGLVDETHAAVCGSMWGRRGTGFMSVKESQREVNAQMQSRKIVMRIVCDRSIGLLKVQGDILEIRFATAFPMQKNEVLS